MKLRPGRQEKRNVWTKNFELHACYLFLCFFSSASEDLALLMTGWLRSQKKNEAKKRPELSAA